MRRALGDRLCLGCAVAICATLGPTALGASPTDVGPDLEPPRKPDAELLKVIDEVRANEARYRDLDITLKITFSREPVRGSAGWKWISNSRSVYDGDRFYFHAIRTAALHGLPTTQREVLATFDGEKTHTIEYGNTVNIHFGRREPGQMVPPHSWLLSGDRVNFALSTLLLGTEGLRQDPKTPEIEGGVGHDFYRVQCHFDGRETIDGLGCVRIACVEDRSGVGTQVSHFWIAPERNYLPIKSRVDSTQRVPSEHPWLESSVTAWKKIDGQRWLPARIVTRQWRPEGDEQHWDLVAEQTQQLESVVVGRKHDDGFFREVTFPRDVPIFTIRNDRLADDVLETVRKVPDSAAALRAVIETLRREEQKFADLDIRMHEAWRNLASGPSPWFPATLWSRDRKSHWTAVGNQRYVEASLNSAQTAGLFASSRVEAFDGTWCRKVFRQTRHLFAAESAKGNLKSKRGSIAESHDPSESRISASLSKRSAAQVAETFRPHAGLFDDFLEWYAPRPALSEFLTTGIWYVGSGDSPTRRAAIRYVGRDRRDGLDCDVIEIAYDHSEISQLVWLAKDRNLLPVRLERRNQKKNRSLPVGFARIEEMREVEKGIWCPIKVTETACDGNEWTRDRVGRVKFNWRRELFVDEIDLHPTYPNDTDAKLTIPKGTEVTINVAEKSSVVVRQESTGPPAASPDAWRKGVFVRIVRRSNMTQGQNAEDGETDALVGASLPLLPKGTWINSRPLTWRDDLYGRVVVLHFFAEQVKLCEPDLKWIAQDLEQLTKKGIVVLGVHPPSAIGPVTNLASNLGLKYPIFIDPPPPDWSASWGLLGDACDIRFVPTTVVVGRDGKIYGRGTLGHVLHLAEEALQDHGRRRNLRSGTKSLESH